MLRSIVLIGVFAMMPLALGCGDDDEATGGSGGSAGTGGTAGGGGTAGTGGSSGATFDLTFTGNGFQGAHDGQTMYYALYDDADDSAPTETRTATIDQDPLVEVFTDALVEGHSYTLYYYADVNSNGMCDGPSLGEDHAWANGNATVTADVILTESHNIDFDGDCSKH